MKTTSRLNGPVAAALTKVYPSQPPTRIVRSFANDVLNSSGVKKMGPPFDPFACARALTVKVQYESIGAEGVFFDDKTTGPKVILRKPLNRTSSWRRANFTLAHELGHYVIRRSLAGFFPESLFRDNDPEEEFLCNIFAEELLMPGSTISQDFRTQGIDPDSFFELTNKYDVSLKCLLCRATGYGKGGIVSIIWDNNDGEYSACWASPTAFRRALLCDTRNTSVERAFTSGQPERGRDELILRGRRMKWRSVSKRLQESTTVLTIMRRSDVPYDFLVGPALEAIGPANIRTTIPTQRLLPFAV
jgi:hypothetical protein